jgi:alanyl-tRNA synthetase
MTAQPTSGATPPTVRLYWSRPQDRQFTATVTGVNGQTVALDQSLFYPEGGGQASDAGMLHWDGSEAIISDVQKEAEIIWHTLEGQVPDVGTVVTGALDWQRRSRHSQRHTAEHLLAQAFWRVNRAFGVKSVSMRGPECTLDLSGQPGESHVHSAQQLLQETLREGLTLETLMVPADELQRFPLRRPPQVSGPVRVVLFRLAGGEIWEASACGGTHLPLGVQAAPVVILRTERVKGDLTRITFMAGEEAQERLSRVYGQAQMLARSFSVGIDRLPERVSDLQADLVSVEARLATVQGELAAQLLDQATWLDLPGGQMALVQPSEQVKTLPLPEQADLLPALLEGATRHPDRVVIVLTTGGSCGVSSTLPQYPAGALLRSWLQEAGGRGGGRPELARGQTDSPEAFGKVVLAWRDALS